MKNLTNSNRFIQLVSQLKHGPISNIESFILKNYPNMLGYVWIYIDASQQVLTKRQKVNKIVLIDWDECAFRLTQLESKYTQYVAHTPNMSTTLHVKKVSTYQS